MHDHKSKWHRNILDFYAIVSYVLIGIKFLFPEEFVLKYIVQYDDGNIFYMRLQSEILVESYFLLFPLFFSYNRFVAVFCVLINVLSKVFYRIKTLQLISSDLGVEFDQMRSYISNAIGAMMLVVFVFSYVYLDYKLQTSDEANKRKDIQVMKVIHDLKNPILSIKNSLLDFKINPEGTVKTTQLDCEDMEEMLENMRAEFKLKQGMQLKEQNKDIETEEFAKSFANTHSQLCENGKNFLHIVVEKDFPKVLTIPRTLIKRMTNNFITNSLKHTNKGHVHISFQKTDYNEMHGYQPEVVHVGPEPEKQEQYLCIEIKDTGAGIPENKLLKVFEEKESDDTGANFDGTGLGLPICKQLCYQMGSFIRYASTQDPEEHGTWFKLYFKDVSQPTKVGKRIVIDQDYLTNEEEKLTTFSHTCNMLLIAEDSKNIMKRYIKWLDKQNFPYRAFYNGRDLLEFIHMSNYVGCRKCSKIIVVTDMFMPYLNGNDLAVEIRRIKTKKHFKLILVSADEISDPNFDVVIEKPASMNQIKDIYHEYFQMMTTSIKGNPNVNYLTDEIKEQDDKENYTPKKVLTRNTLATKSLNIRMYSRDYGDAEPKPHVYVESISENKEDGKIYNMNSYNAKTENTSNLEEIKLNDIEFD